MTGRLFTLLVDIPLKPGRADEFMALLDEVFEAMKIEETFVSATALRVAEDPDTILLYGPTKAAHFCQSLCDPNHP
jgi:quinol monooxygenase YgiN